MKTLQLTLLVTLFSHLSFAQSNWQIVYQNDAEGKPIQGDIQLLINAVRKGFPIRVGWGFQRPEDPSVSVEHVADASFLTIMSQNLVQAQLAPIYGQRPKFEEEVMEFRENYWILIANTNGKSVAAIRNFNSGALENQTLSNRKFTWYVNAPMEKLKDNSDALF